MRFFSYLFHGLLALFLLAISAMAMGTGMHSIHLDMLPWQGQSLTYWLLGASLAGLAAVVLAISRVLPLLFFVWALIVFVMMVKGYIFGGYYFSSGEFRTAVMLMAGALIALLGAWYGLKQGKARM